MTMLLGDLDAGWDRAHGMDLDALTSVEVEALVGEVTDLRARALAFELAVLSRYDTQGEWAHHGATSPASYLAVTNRIPITEARRPFRVARGVRELPALTEALKAGAIAEAHVSRVLAADNPRVHEALVTDQVMITRWAVDLPWKLFVRKLQDWLDEHDQDGPEPEHAERSLHLSRTIDDRWKIDGLLDPIGGTVVHTELSRLERQLFEADWRAAASALGRDPLVHELARTSAQRRADALVLMAERSATLPEDGRRGAPLFTVLAGHESFARILELTNGTQARPGQLVEWIGPALVETIVFDGPFHAVAASSQRTFTGVLRRAVMAMHRECTDEYCVAPLEECQVDHHVPHSKGGPTSQANGRPKCPKHNRAKADRAPPPDSPPSPPNRSD